MVVSVGQPGELVSWHVNYLHRLFVMRQTSTFPNTGRSAPGFACGLCILINECARTVHHQSECARYLPVYTEEKLCGRDWVSNTGHQLGLMNVKKINALVGSQLKRDLTLAISRRSVRSAEVQGQRRPLRSERGKTMSGIITRGN